MEKRRLLLVRLSIFVEHLAPRAPPAGCSRWPCSALKVKEAGAHREFSSIPECQESQLSTKKWHGLPPVPMPLSRWTALKLETNHARHQGSSNQSNELNQAEERLQRLTALQWVTKCCPSLPISLVHKLFRMRQIRKRAPLHSMPTDKEHPVLSDVREMETRMRKVSLRAVLEEGTILYLPDSVSQDKECKSRSQCQPTKREIEWLQSLVLYKDSDILLINKPRGLAVQGGSAVKQDLDSLMRFALSFEYKDGPRLVHRLDKDTSGIMVVARTQECAMLLHALFREKTAFPTESESSTYGVGRLYRALVIGIPQQKQGRITAPVFKMVLDEGRVDKMTIARDNSSKNAQLTITDYKVLGPSCCGCTWLELQPRTGRKHQLRVHCAEVLGTPVLGDTKYGWRTHKEWLKQPQQDSKSLAFGVGNDDVESFTNPIAVQHSKPVKGSVLDKEPLLHLHSHQLSLPDVARILEKHRSRINYSQVKIDRLQFVAPMPPHMAASWDLWFCRNQRPRNQEVE